MFTDYTKSLHSAACDHYATRRPAASSDEHACRNEASRNDRVTFATYFRAVKCQGRIARADYSESETTELPRTAHTLLATQQREADDDPFAGARR